MTGCTSIGIDDDLASGHSAVGFRTAQVERSGRIDQNLGLRIEPRAQSDGQEGLTHVFVDRILAGVGPVLRGDNDRGDLHRAVVLVSNSNLAFGIGTKERHFALVTMRG